MNHWAAVRRDSDRIRWLATARLQRSAVAAQLGCLLLLGGLVKVAAAAAAVPDQSRGGGLVPHRNAILITIDTLRADTLGFAGDAKVETPTLDRLASTGRVFAKAHAHAVTTLPSHASILTGLYPFQHGVRHNGGFVLADDIPTLSSMLQAEGFATAAFVAAFPLDSRFGLARGFDVYDDEVGDQELNAQQQDAGSALFSYSERRGDDVVERALSWWLANRDQRKFLWVHLFDPHAPYAPPEPFRSRFATDPYRGEVSAVDAFLTPLLGRFVEGEESSTVIAFTSDHGESLGEHGEATHGLFAYESTLAVPMVLWGDGIEPARDDRSARHIDLMPTLLAALGEEPIPDLPGRSLLDPASGHPKESFFEALSAHLDYGWAPMRGVLEGDRKLIVLPIPELYELGEDPGEQHNLFVRERGTAQALVRLIPEESSWPPAMGEISEDDAERLRSLGYLGAKTVKKQRYTAADDPKTLVALDHKVGRLADLATRGEARQAIKLGEEILKERPSMGVVYIYLSTLLIQTGELERAVEVMTQARQEGVAGRELLRQLGLTLVNTGRAQEAKEILTPLAEKASDLEARNHLALALTYLGLYDQADSILRSLLAADPKLARTYENLSFLAITRQRYREARVHAEKALGIDQDLVGSWNNLGIALYNLDSSTAAIDAWKQALQRAPDNLDVLLNMGLVEAQLENEEHARQALARFLELASGPGYASKRQQASELLQQLGD